MFDGFTPDAVSRIAVTADGAMAAIIEPSRAVVVRLGGGGFEVGLPASDCDVAWVGGRMLVVARSDSHTTAYLIETSEDAPRTLAEIRLEASMRLMGTIGAHALLFGHTAAVLATGDGHLAPYQFMARTLPAAVGVAGTQFVVGLVGTIEEWDPVSRMPKRRFKLARTGTITALGGTDRLLWLTTQQEPTRIEVLPLINRGQAKSHELGEPIGSVLSHPQCDVVVAIGAESGTLYAIDLDGRLRQRTLAPDGIDHPAAAALVVARGVGALVAQPGKPLAFVSIDGRELEAPRAQTAPIRDPRGEITEPLELEDATTFASAIEASAGAAKAVEERAPEPRPGGSSDLLAKLASMRDAAGIAAAPARGTWRDELAAWVRAGVFDRAPSCPAVERVAARLEVAPLAPALILLYGCHLAGIHGAAPADVARVLGQWDEALGRGRFAKLGFAIYERSRVVLAPAVERELDEL